MLDCHGLEIPAQALAFKGTSCNLLVSRTPLAVLFLFFFPAPFSEHAVEVGHF